MIAAATATVLLLLSLRPSKRIRRLLLTLPCLLIGRRVTRMERRSHRHTHRTNVTESIHTSVVIGEQRSEMGVLAVVGLDAERLLGWSWRWLLSLRLRRWWLRVGNRCRQEFLLLLLLLLLRLVLGTRWDDGLIAECERVVGAVTCRLRHHRLLLLLLLLHHCLLLHPLLLLTLLFGHHHLLTHEFLLLLLGHHLLLEEGLPEEKNG